MQRLQTVLNTTSLKAYTKQYLALSDNPEEQSLVIETLVSTINSAL
jgi:hypothetical protein